MNPDQKAQIKEKLHTLRSSLTQSLEDSQTAGQTVELDQTRQGRLSRMDALQGQAMAQAATRRATEQLRQITQRLIQIDTAEFGLCEDCVEPIAFPRLLSNPLCRLCIACAEARER